MLQKVTQFVKENKMIEMGDKVVVGVSGGADSVCLFLVLRQLQIEISFELIVIHIEHGIRGKDSLSDAKYVENLCKEYNVAFRQYSYEVEKIALERRQSTEEVGRELRYESFFDACIVYGANKIAVAHNKNDNAETMLFHLFRGSGLKGLGGIAPVRDCIIRPILCLERREIEAYLKNEKREYCHDHTNEEDGYSRNKIRHHILPFAQEQLNEKAVNHIYTASQMLRETQAYLEMCTKKIFEDCVQKEGEIYYIRREQLEREVPIIQKNLIKMMLETVAGQGRDLTHAHTISVLKLLEKPVGRYVHLPYAMIASGTYEHIVLKKQYVEIKKEKIQPISVLIEENQEEKIFIPGEHKREASFYMVKEKKSIIMKKKYTKCFDYDRIKGGLQIRTRQAGDYLIVSNSGSHQKLKDYMINQKIPVDQRDEILLLADDHHILWVIGYRISEAYKITEDTIYTLKVQVSGGQWHE